MRNDAIPVLMLGCGRMGGAIARALVPARRVLAFDPHADLPDGVERIEDLSTASLPRELAVILAVKPQAFGGMRDALAPLAGEGRLFVSIMAGITLAGLADMFDTHAAIVRAMPNTPAAIGCGIAAAVASATVDGPQREIAADILRATGDLVWLDDEEDLDAVTAVSGSGPAYFFRFAESLVRAGVAEGLSEAVATRLARQTFIGAGRLAETEAAIPLGELRRQVTSPGGTTAAGLGAMDEPITGSDAGAVARIDGLARDVVEAAARRSRELAGG